MSEPRPMAFQRHGRSYHLIINSAEDLDQVLRLDEALWVATGAPLDSINCDAVFLSLVDSDSNGRILCAEMKDAIRWVRAIFKDTTGIDSRSTTLRMAALNADHEDGAQMQRSHQSARKILVGNGAPSEDEITLDQVRAMKQKVEATPISESGVVLPEAAKDPEVRQFIADVLATIGGAAHPAGAMGVNQAQLDRFLAGARAFLDWHTKDNIPAGQTRTEVMPLGANTPAAYASVAELRGVVDLFFSQCRAVELDARLGEQMYPKQSDLDAMNLGDPAVLEKIMKDAPPARPNAGRVLPLETGTNPFYADALKRLRSQAVEPILARSAREITEADWMKVKAFLAAYDAWLASKPAEPLDALGEAKLAGYLGPKFKSAMESLIAEGATTAFVLGNIRLTEKAILYQANIIPLANNFVSFPDLYSEKGRAMFEVGALVMDGRRFNLAVKALNRAQHAEVARNGSMFVLYVELTNRKDGHKMEVAMPVVAGGRGNLNVGKRGLFVDPTGDEWDAQVVQVIENPISLIEAIISPFTRLGKMVTGKIESASASAEQKLQAKASSVPGTPPAPGSSAPAQPAPAAAAAPAPAPAPAGGGAATLLMGGSVAVAALGAGAAYIAQALKGFAAWQILLGIAGAIILLLSPLMLLAVLKLRKRDLSAILEGSGWAINARMRLTRRQCALFTQKPKYPKDSTGIRRSKWWMLIVAGVLVVLAGFYVLGLWAQAHHVRILTDTDNVTTKTK